MALLLCYLCTKLLPDNERMLNMLLCQNDRTILPAYWGEDVPFAHKTGGLPGIIHDAGILYPPHAPKIPFILVALTSDMEDEPLTRYTLARVGGAIYTAISRVAV
jgi:beta-lactamase class A